MDNLDAVLKAHGTSLKHTVKFTIFVRPFRSCFSFLTDHISNVLKTIDHIIRYVRRA